MRPGPPSTPDLPRVLYVEDEDDNWTIAQLRLRQRFAMIRAANDREACEIVRQSGSQLWAVLMDIQLKGAHLDGINLTRLFKGRPLAGVELPPWAAGIPRLSAPIFVITAYGEGFPHDELLSAGADRVITKPVNFVDLAAGLEALPR